MEDQAALFNGLQPGSIFRFAGIDQLGIAGQGDLLVRVVHHQIAAGGPDGHIPALFAMGSILQKIPVLLVGGEEDVLPHPCNIAHVTRRRAVTLHLPLLPPRGGRVFSSCSHDSGRTVPKYGQFW